MTEPRTPSPLMPDAAAIQAALRAHAKNLHDYQGVSDYDMYYVLHSAYAADTGLAALRKLTEGYDEPRRCPLGHIYNEHPQGCYTCWQRDRGDELERQVTDLRAAHARLHEENQRLAAENERVLEIGKGFETALGRRVCDHQRQREQWQHDLATATARVATLEKGARELLWHFEPRSDGPNETDDIDVADQFEMDVEALRAALGAAPTSEQP